MSKRSPIGARSSSDGRSTGSHGVRPGSRRATGTLRSRSPPGVSNMSRPTAARHPATTARWRRFRCARCRRRTAYRPRSPTTPPRDLASPHRTAGSTARSAAGTIASPRGAACCGSARCGARCCRIRRRPRRAACSARCRPARRRPRARPGTAIAAIAIAIDACTRPAPRIRAQNSVVRLDYLLLGLPARARIARACASSQSARARSAVAARSSACGDAGPAPSLPACGCRPASPCRAGRAAAPTATSRSRPASVPGASQATAS